MSVPILLFIYIVDIYIVEIICSASHPMFADAQGGNMATSEAFLAEASVWSRRCLFVFTIKMNIRWGQIIQKHM